MRLALPTKGTNKTFKDLNGLMAFINKDDANKEDHTVKISGLEITQRKTLAFKTGKEGTEEFSFSDHSFRQLCGVAKIPWKYLQSCKPTGRGGMKDQLESRLEDKKSKQMLIRVRRNDEQIEGVSGVVRAILPGSHNPFDNRHMLWAVQRAMKDLGKNYRLVSHNASESRSIEMGLHMRLVQREKFDVVGDEHQMGFHCMTSEIGKSHISVAALVWRLVCRNGMMGWGDSEVLKLQHTRCERHEVYPQVHEAVKATTRQEETIRDMLMQSHSEPAGENPYNDLIIMGKRMRLNDGVTDRAMELFRESGENNPMRFHLLQAFTAAARELPVHQRVEAEEIIGGFMFGGTARRRRRGGDDG